MKIADLVKDPVLQQSFEMLFLRKSDLRVVRRGDLHLGDYSFLRFDQDTSLH